MNTQMGNSLPREKLDWNNFVSWQYKMPNRLVWVQKWIRLSWPIVRSYLCFLTWLDYLLLNKPIWCRSDWNWSAARNLVFPSNMLSIVEIFSRPSFPKVMQSWTKWYPTSICLEACCITSRTSLNTGVFLTLLQRGGKDWMLEYTRKMITICTDGKTIQIE